MVMDQMKRWQLDGYLEETRFENLVYRAPRGAAPAPPGRPRSRVGPAS
jgi:hypothetical protein